MPKLKIKLPKNILEAPEEVRAELIQTLQKALKVSTPPASKAGEHNIWARNDDGLLADAEDDFYYALLSPAMQTIASLFHALGLPIEDLEVQKAFSDEFLLLYKSKNGLFRNLLDVLKEGYKKSKAFLHYAKQKGKAYTQKQLNQLDEILSEHSEDPIKLVNEFMARVGFVAKIRQEADKQGIQIDRAQVDEYPKTIIEGEEKGITCEVQGNQAGERVQVKLEIPPFTEQEAESLKHAEAHCAEKIREVQDRQRAQIKQVVIRALKEHKSPRELAQELFDTFGDHNRDWRRVAITELAMAQNDAYLAGCEDGARVYIPPVDHTCKYCKQLIDGKTFYVAKKPEPDKAYTHVWAGKSNFGRKASEYIPCAPLHPHCRHRYHRISPFHKLVDGKLVLKKREEVMQEIQEKLARKAQKGG